MQTFKIWDISTGTLAYILDREFGLELSIWHPCSSMLSLHGHVNQFENGLVQTVTIGPQIGKAIRLAELDQYFGQVSWHPSGCAVLIVSFKSCSRSSPRAVLISFASSDDWAAL